MNRSDAEKSRVADHGRSWLQPEFTAGLVSVIIPTHNRANLVVQAIESVTMQSWPSIEIVVVDDGSEDGTLEILRARPEWVSGHRLRIVQQPNRGVSAARNHGTRRCDGEFIMYLDSDDTLVPDAVECYVKAIRESGCDYCYSWIGGMDAEGRPLPDKGDWHSQPMRSGDLITNMWSVHGACYRREVFNKAGPWDESMPCCEDHAFNLRIKWTSRGVHLPKIQGYYRLHRGDQLHRRYSQDDDYRYDIMMLEKFTTWVEQRERVSAELRDSLVARYRFIIFRQGSIGDREMKDRAVRNIVKLLKGTCSYQWLFTLARWVDSPVVYRELAWWKMRLTRMIQRS